MNFQSDNVTGACPQVLEAIVAANGGSEGSYGADQWTARAVEAIQAVFETEADVFLVPTGTAANALCLAALAQPYEGVLCHHNAHVNTAECGAPEFYTAGAKLMGLDGAMGKLTPAVIDAAFDGPDMGDQLVRKAALSISQSTESGTVYTPDEIGALAARCRQHGLGLHMDGARFANGLVSLGCTPAEMTWKAGVQVLSFGATKNGALAAEAVVIFDRNLARDMGRRRKRGGHLFSKMRLLGAQWVGYLDGDRWLDNARHANAMAAHLAEGLTDIAGIEQVFPVQANEVFVMLPDAMREELEAAGFLYHSWPHEGRLMTRLVTAFNTDAAHVNHFVDTARRFA